MSAPQTTIDRLIGRARQLYSLPAVAMQVLELTNNPRIDAAALKACIENDPALTTRLLKVVNSSLFGFSRQVGDLNQALALLGTKPLKLLVLGFSLPPRLFAGLAAEVLGRYWRRTLTKAVAARRIGQGLVPGGGDPFIAALLQDVGVLLLIQELGEPYVLLLERTDFGGRELLAMENASMGFDHRVLSARLLESWGLPEALVDAVERRADEEALAGLEPSQRTVVATLYLAELAAQVLVDRRDAALRELLAAGERLCGLDRDRLAAVVEGLSEQVAQLAEALAVQLAAENDYRDVLVTAHARLAETAAAAAAELAAAVRPEVDPAACDEEHDLAAELELLSSAVTRLTMVREEDLGAPPDGEGVAGVAAKPTPPVLSTAADQSPLAAAPLLACPGGGHNQTRMVLSPADVFSSSTVASPSGTAIEADPGLVERLAAAVHAARQSRCPLSLLLAELDEIEQIVLHRGVEWLALPVRFLEATCRRLDHSPAVCLPYGEAGFAVILVDCERQLAVGLGNQVVESFHRLQGRQAGTRPLLRVSVGAASVALPPKNFPAADLLNAAARCLYGSHASGGGVVKSIEIY